MRILSTVAAALSIIGYATAQHRGTQKMETAFPFALTTCTDAGQCQSQARGVTLDANWRWTHSTYGYQNCYTGNTWDSNLCATPMTCT
jgi:cellulose 1,4-beta-cellobiosidase